ncbi:NADH-quinone oxidoreductase subunit N [Candidatus Nitrosocosmicus oleophilus]|jgi:NADH-quinone oxidoreductase subunit N|uniref:NADH-quinone oxidoreductase subunit N n=1 Tax=Candidatus Nitrosocosmicus oleophilus TaxID=1353260 RepID=A0A654MA45_9ARCH|nr:NADH-quinone oxidoreductase subunit N [Candidatus Nitrosocosmicus oleophilus]ALI36352.1 NADH-quinone oxidoreductase subunit N [Candidatus Nitrosocosmicus oleophilus]HTH21282.1 NADH-quinone oxidoreductase subunit N [Nitrososphaeraceae archaeon]
MIDIMSTPALVTIILGSVALLIPIIDALNKERGSKNKVYSAIAFGALALALIVVIYRIFSGENLPAMSLANSGAIGDDIFGAFFSIAFLIVSIMVTVSSWSYMKKRSNHAAYYSLILLSSIGMILIGYSTDFVMLLVAWELMSIPTYALAAFNKKDPISNEASIKYFLFGALSSAIIVLAMGIVYGLTGTTNIYDSIVAMSHLNADLVPFALLAVGLFIAGFGFKMGLVPFHMWLPDTYSGAPTTIATLLAAGTKKAGFAAAIRVIVIGMIALNVHWTFTLAIIAIFTMTLGNLGALTQKSIPRILAYSSIAQAGYILIGLAVAPYSDYGLDASLLQIMNHAVMKSAAFIAAAGVIITLAAYTIEKYKGLGYRMPITAFVFAISLLALAGVPPLSGFWGKYLIFGAAIDSGQVVWWGPYLAIAGILNSALSLGYYAWIIRKMYMEEGENRVRQKEPKPIVAVLLFALGFMIIFGIWYGPLLDLASMAVPNDLIHLLGAN